VETFIAFEFLLHIAVLKLINNDLKTLFFALYHLIGLFLNIIRLLILYYGGAGNIAAAKVEAEEKQLSTAKVIEIFHSWCLTFQFTFWYMSLEKFSYFTHITVSIFSHHHMISCA